MKRCYHFAAARLIKARRLLEAKVAAGVALNRFTFFISLSLSLLCLRLWIGDTLIAALPPGTMVFFNLACFFSLYRLKDLEIFGLNPNLLLQAGRINVICFDKTGTLTNSWIDIYGYWTP